jgi:hypothetical protein
LHTFKGESQLAEEEVREVISTTIDSVQDVIRELQMNQELRGSLMYMKRLEPFLVLMQQFGDVAKTVGVFVGSTDFMAYVWVSPVPSSINESLLTIIKGTDEICPPCR